jgi:dolichol-phosphate mannosyltransferase
VLSPGGTPELNPRGTPMVNPGGTPMLSPGGTPILSPGGTPVLSVVVPCFNERPNVAPMIAKLDAALAGIAWEVIYVDDNSPDGTTQEVRRIARTDSRVRCIRRIGRRGLASAVIEGALSSSADYIAVIDGDLQHDETRLPVMLATLQGGGYDLAVASRHVEGGDSAGLSSRWRHMLSDGGIFLAQAFLPVRLTDPMSGFFMLPRPLFEDLARGLNGQGFKILLDLVLSSTAPLRVLEVPAHFRERAAGESKMDALVMVQFVGLLLDKVFGGLLPLRFFSFALVGALGILIHLLVLAALHMTTGLGFEADQAIATLVAMAFNFQLNNAITYRDQRLRGPRLWRGLILFMVVCGFGAIANIGIAQMMYEQHTTWTVAGGIGAMIGVVWNYAVSATLVWRSR